MNDAMNVISKNLVLSGIGVELQPMLEEHIPMLLTVASEKRIWEHYPFDGSIAARLDKELKKSLAKKEKLKQFPFIIKKKAEEKIIGSTRFLNIDLENRNVEIGFTWLHPDYWATGVNTECKLLLMTYCFEELDLERVQYKTDELNIRSRKAIEKLGGQFEGIHRNDRLRDNGTYRSSAFYSILKSEWESIKQQLMERVKQY
ncbi:MAG: GNAT family protein [Flavipsychrobacter sp.]